MTGAYADGQTAQNAADFGALAAAQELGYYVRGESVTDADVYAELWDYAHRQSDEIDKVGGNYRDQNGFVLARIGDGLIPNNALGIEATATITAETFFAGVVGLHGLSLERYAAVQFESVCYAGGCLLPVGVYGGGYEYPPEPVEFVSGQCYNLWDGSGGANFGWLNWSNQGTVDPPIGEFSCKEQYGLSECSTECLDRLMNPLYCSTQPDNMVGVGDEVGGGAGVKNASVLLNYLDDYIDNNIVARVPVYNQVIHYGGAQCGRTKYKDGEVFSRSGTFYVVGGIGAFQITGYRLSDGVGGAVTRDTIDPSTCVNYPGDSGECCLEWVWDDFDEDWDCTEWVPCNYEEGNTNRITGIARPWTEYGHETCEAIGNVLAPTLDQ
jgi:hypothetical protein